MMQSPPTDEITTREALDLLGLANPSSISRLVEAGKLTPSRRIGTGKVKPMLFWRADILRLAAAREAVESERTAAEA